MKFAIFLGMLAACATPDRRAQGDYYRTHPMAECREMLRQADIGRGFRSAGNTASGAPQETTQIDPCAIGCRIPVCGYPAANTER